MVGLKRLMSAVLNTNTAALNTKTASFVVLNDYARNNRKIVIIRLTKLGVTKKTYTFAKVNGEGFFSIYDELGTLLIAVNWEWENVIMKFEVLFEKNDSYSVCQLGYVSYGAPVGNFQKALLIGDFDDFNLEFF